MADTPFEQFHAHNLMIADLLGSDQDQGSDPTNQDGVFLLHFRAHQTHTETVTTDPAGWKGNKLIAFHHYMPDLPESCDRGRR